MKTCYGTASEGLHAAWKSEVDMVSGQRTLSGEKPEDGIGISQTNRVWRYSRDEEHSEEQKWDLKTPGVKREHGTAQQGWGGERGRTAALLNVSQSKMMSRKQDQFFSGTLIM